MAITYVGGVQGGRAGATGTTTQSLSGTLAGGSNTSPSAGDLVVVWLSVGTANAYVPTTLAVSGNNNGAYSTETMQSADDTNDSYSQLNYKIQGGTVDTSLTIPSSGNARNAQRWVVHVFRGVDGTTPLDATSVPASGINTGRPDPSAITPNTTGAWIAAYYASAAGAGTAYTAPSELSGWLGSTTADTYDCMQGGGYYSSWSSGAYNPQAITAGGTTGTGDSWTAMTIALKPAATGYDALAALHGSFTLTGQATALKAGYSISASQGSFTITGQATNFTKGQSMTAGQGAFTITGQATNFTAGYTLTASQGSFALTGQNTGLAKGYLMTAGLGSFTHTGHDANLVTTRNLTATHGAFTTTGYSTSFLHHKTIATSQGSYALTGQATGLLKSSTLGASNGSFTLTGQGATLTYTQDNTLTASQGSFTVTGYPVTLTYTGGTNRLSYNKIQGKLQYTLGESYVIDL